MDEEILDFQQRIERHENDLNHKRDAYQVLGSRLEDLEVKVRKSALMYLADNPDAKKMSMDKLEMAASITPEQKADYFELMGLRIREKIAEKMIDSIHGSMSAVQSLMSYWKSTNIHGLK
jgi:hypothetical protein